MFVICLDLFQVHFMTDSVLSPSICKKLTSHNRKTKRTVLGLSSPPHKILWKTGILSLRSTSKNEGWTNKCSVFTTFLVSNDWSEWMKRRRVRHIHALNEWRTFVIHWIGWMKGHLSIVAYGLTFESPWGVTSLGQRWAHFFTSASLQILGESTI